MALSAIKRRVGEYEVGRRLGEGATALVRLGRHVRTGKLVALKILSRDAVRKNAVIARTARREIAVLELVASDASGVDGVLKLHDVIETDDGMVLALEYCPAGDLYEKVCDEGHLSEAHAREYFMQLAKALYICHLRGVCHRDLKLENVLIAPDGSLRIADFGMAGLLKPHALLGTACGSPYYCAPELLSEKPYCGTKADVWSLGVMLYVMLCGGYPFEDDNIMRLKRKVCSGLLYIPPEISPATANLLRSMLTVNPEERYTVQQVLQSEWIGINLLPVDTRKNYSADFPPVSNPDPKIIATLVDLGLGNSFMLRRRLSGERSSVERRLYYQIAATATEDGLQPIKAPNANMSPTLITSSDPFKVLMEPQQPSLRSGLSAKSDLTSIDDNF